MTTPRWHFSPTVEAEATQFGRSALVHGGVSATSPWQRPLAEARALIARAHEAPTEETLDTVAGTVAAIFDRSQATLIAVLSGWSSDRSSGGRAAVVRALGRCRDSATREIREAFLCSRALRDSDTGVRYEAVYALSFVARDPREVLSAVRVDESSPVVTAAIDEVIAADD
jgi:hypothetical protein